MDPVTPWFASYNRLTAGTTAGSFQTGGTSSGDFISHHLSATTASQNATPSTTASQLLLQATHSTSSLNGQSSFNPTGFLTSPSVNYNVFSPLFHHSTLKQTHYASSHRQQPVTHTPTTSASPKQSTTPESEVSSISENYNVPHQQTFFEHLPAPTASTGATLPYYHQSNCQIPSPFGILPHKSVVSTSPGPPPPPPPPPLSSSSLSSSSSSLSSSSSSSSSSSLSSAAAVVSLSSASSSSSSSPPSSSSSSSSSSSLSSSAAATSTLLSSSSSSSSSPLSSSSSSSSSLLLLSSSSSSASPSPSLSSSSFSVSSPPSSALQPPPSLPPTIPPPPSSLPTPLSSPPTASKPNENNFNTRPPPESHHKNINSTLPPVSATTDFKSTSCSDENKILNRTSPLIIKSKISTASDPNKQGFFQQTPNSLRLNSPKDDYSGSNGNTMHQQTCAIPIPMNNTSEDYRISQALPIRSLASTAMSSNATGPSALNQNQDKNSTMGNFVPSNVKTAQANTHQLVRTNTQAKISPELCNHEYQRTESGQENCQSPPIGYTMMDARTLNYVSNTTTNGNDNGSEKLVNNQRTPTNCDLHHTQQRYHVMNSQHQSSLSQLPLSQQAQQQTIIHRHCISAPNESEYLHSDRSKSVTSTDSAYSSNTSTQNGSDCSVIISRRQSPLHSHSQSSPIGHVASPAYPIYNSPMTTISSPLQQHTDINSNSNQCSSVQSYKTVVQQQITPQSPLDVSVHRPTSQSQVAYSSVIMRVLGNAENNKTNYDTENPSYDRHGFRHRQKQQQHQTFWDNDNGQSVDVDSRKYSTACTSNSANINSQIIPNRQHQSHRVLNVTDRPEGYYDSSQVTLQDLSNCHGDPINSMKHLQSGSLHTPQQQSSSNLSTQNDMQKQLDGGQRKTHANIKRRSFDKNTGQSMPLNEISGPVMMTEYFNRIPPPAHHNSNQPTQNGYFDFERWNITTPPTSKIFSGSSGAFGSQNTLHHTSNFVGNLAHQHQSLMVPHHHSQSLSYFSPFHLPPGHHPNHHHTEYPSSTDMLPISYGETSMPIQNSDYQDNPEEQPKVIVPNIEEELGFLQQNQFPVHNNHTNEMNRDMKSLCREPNTGFMTSYLKFLQGEREPSPPPALRGGKKITWNRLKPYSSIDANKSNDISENGRNIKRPNNVTETPTIDYANDPRYFPLPKERKKPYIDSSDDGITSDDDFPFSIKKHEKKQQNNFTSTHIVENTAVKPETKPKKGRPIKPGGPTDRKRKAAAAALAAGTDIPSGRKPSKSESNPVILPPRRESSKRKAKEKLPTKQFIDNSEDEEQGDSDSDPAWTPAAKLTGDDEEKKKKRGRPVISKRTKKELDDDYTSNEVMKKRGRKKFDLKNTTSKFPYRIDEKLLASVSDEDIDISPFKSGEFVVIKSELEDEYPALWRIDGKTLLQKYEPFDSNGKKLYRNISTYSGWTSQNRHLYQQVPVRFWQQGKLETIVEFLRDEMIIDDRECIIKSIKDNEKYQDSFEVYIQTLISQALDSNFLTEIFQEQDEYFLSNVKTIDEVTEERKRRLLSTTKWEINVVTAISTWPCLNVLKDLPNIECKGKHCIGCNRNKIFARVLLYGQPYNTTTLEGSPPDTKVPHDKDFLLCRVCQTKVALFNKVAHQKYLMFLECARRVADKRLTDPNKDTTIILNELLADETWLNQLFKEVRNIWAEIDSIEHQAKLKENVYSTSTDEKQHIDTAVHNLPSVIHSQLSTNLSTE